MHITMNALGKLLFVRTFLRTFFFNIVLNNILYVYIMCIDCEANSVLGVEVRKLRFSDFFCT